MFSLSQEFHRACRERNQAPLIIFSLANAYGVRLYSDRYPSDQTLGLLAGVLADGGGLADGALSAGEGSKSLLDRGARVVSFGRLRETLTPFKGDLLASLKQEEPASLNLALSNAGADGQRPFTRLEATENLLGAVGEILIGLAGVKPRDYLRRFRGRVESYQLEAETLTLSLKAI
jgi:hypothetical protein